jgi:outer membrane protein assembly factor BamB
MTRPVRHAVIAVIALGSAAIAPGLFAQGRGAAEWTTSGGNAQRTSWIRSDPRISVASMAKGAEGFGPFKFLWKLKVDSDPRKPNPLTQPVLLDRIIGFRGFKSVAFVATSSGTVYAIDTDVGTELWKVHLNYGASLPPLMVGTAECPAGVTAAITRPTALTISAFGGGGGFAARGGRSGGGVGEAGRGAPSIYTAGQGRGGGAPPGLPATPGAPVPGSAAAAAQAGRAGGPGGGGGGRGQATGAPDAAYAIGNDGYVRALNVQNGWDLFPPVQVLPANTRPAGAIVVNDETTGFLYAVTTHGCAYTPDAVWAVDLISPKKDVVSWEARGATIAGSGGPAFGRDGTIYVATTDGSSPLSNSVVALEPKTLKQKAVFTLAKADFVSAPIVVQHKDKDLVAVAAKDGRVFVLDGASLQVPLAATPAAGPLSGEGLASWQDDKGTRWILATGASSVVAYRLAEEGSGLALQKGWTSRALATPLTPLVVNGVVFALSSGEEAARSSPAVLYALDGGSGKELWNSGKSITAPARGGLSAGAGVVYVPATDSTLYAFGFPIDR